MIVIGGWPGRNVIGLDGRFGVRPAAFATGGEFANPLANDVDAGDTTTEFVLVATQPPSSGTATLDDDGAYTHTGAADGTYTTLATLYTWAQGGPLTQHGTPEAITSTFGSAPIELAGAAQALASGTGSLTTAIRLQGSASAAGAASGTLTTAIRLAGAAAAQAAASGTLNTAGQGLSGAAVAQALATGVLTTQIQLRGLGISIATAFGTLASEIGPVITPVSRRVSVAAQPRRISIAAAPSRTTTVGTT